MSTAPTDQQWTIQRLLEWTKPFFERKGLDEPRLAAEILLAKALGCARLELYTRFDRVPPPEQLAVFRELVNRAADHVPIAYLVGFKEFYSLDFEVSPAVLVPRPETEMLVERSLELIKSGGESACFLEIGTGSGCIAVATCKNASGVRFVATDVSAGALELARRNAEKHGVADRIEFVECSGLELPADAIADGGFDALVSNPPYVAESELADLPRNVKDHEPHMALHDGADGLSFYRMFAESSPSVLKPSGSVLIEIGESQADAVKEIFSAAGGFGPGQVWRDTVGGHERVMLFKREP
ncbi:MAG: peptide chain release factor N(5)-glutamine methyltransferase [Phycisphaerales bacterium]|nr:peptide chain release factor N(5)-glutamine methyltransferase [Phycisphaerales bacterium]